MFGHIHSMRGLRPPGHVGNDRFEGAWACIRGGFCPLRVVMQSRRLWKFSDCSAHQPPVSGGRRALRHFHNHSVFRKSIRVSGAR